MDFKSFTAQYFNGDELKALQHLVKESRSGDYSITGSRQNLKAILDTMTRKDAKKYLHCFMEADAPEHEGPNTNKWGLAFSAFFLILAIWCFVTGCSNILQIAHLNKTGASVQVTVTDKDVEDEGENLVNYYTFSYEFDGKVYNFRHSADREYDIGETFAMHMDPNNPEVLALPSSNLAFAFLFFLFSGASVFLCKETRFLAKYIPHALSGWAALMLVTGILLPNITACILGSIFLTAILVIWILLHMRKKTAK